MNTILSSYDIERETLALLPAKQIDYDTIVIETHANKHVCQTSLNLIELACRKHWSTYEGRRDAVTDNMNFIQKVPIPISIKKRLYFFPTHSPKNMDNCWIAWKHILSVKKAPNRSNRKQTQSIIEFKSGQTLTLDISLHTLQRQVQRTFECVYRIEGMEGAERLYWD